MCVFCQIVAGEIPAYKIYENDDVLAFLDISQVTRGHTLVIPKKHVANLYELTPEVAKPVFEALPKVAQALKDALHPIGLNLINNNDKPLQSVFHLHFHLIPRFENDGLYLGLDKAIPDVDHDAYSALQNSIVSHMQK